MMIDNLFSDKKSVAITLLLLFFSLWLFSFYYTNDRSNWWVENILVFLFIPFLILSKRRIQFTSMSYVFMFLFLSLHIIGSMYAYAGVPFGYSLQQQFHLLRNPYDRIVHFSFGFLMAYPLYDFLRLNYDVRDWRAFVMPIEIILSLSAFFELLEWLIGGVLMPDCEETYVGTQGDIWDAQKDMALATLGAIIIMICFRIYVQVNRTMKKKPLRIHHPYMKE